MLRILAPLIDTVGNLINLTLPKDQRGEKPEKAAQR
jgi:hypothetical protein